MENSEFGIIDKIDYEHDYSDYEPRKYNCVSIHDRYLDDWWNTLMTMKTYFHNIGRPAFGLARWGVTLIPPESLAVFEDIVISDRRIYLDQELIDLAEVIQKAIQDNKYIIHYGV